MAANDEPAEGDLARADKKGGPDAVGTQEKANREKLLQDVTPQSGDVKLAQTQTEKVNVGDNPNKSVDDTLIRQGLLPDTKDLLPDKQELQPDKKDLLPDTKPPLQIEIFAAKHLLEARSTIQPENSDLATVQALSHLAQNKELREKLAGADGRLDLRDLKDAIILNGEIRSGSRLPIGIPNFLSEADKAAVQVLVSNWKSLGKGSKESISVDDLSKFTPEKLTSALPQNLQQEIISHGSSASDAISPEFSQFLKERLKEVGESTEVVPPPGPGWTMPPRAMRTEDFADSALSLFDRINKNRDGVLSDKELSAALEDNSIKDEDAQIVAALYFKRARLSHTGDTTTDTTRGGISKEDLLTFKENEKRISQDLYSSWAVESIGRDEEAFKKYDRNNKGYISRSDLAAAAGDITLSEYDRNTAQILERNYALLAPASNDYGSREERGLTAKDLRNFSQALSESKDYVVIKETAHALRRTYWGQLNQVETLYADENNPLASINPESINQGLINDCYLLAAIGAVSHSDKALVRDMIQDNKDGTYTVTFPGAKGEPITVKAPTQAERGLFNQPGANGIWASVLEKAYGAYCQKSIFRRSPMNLGGGDSPTEGADGGGFYSSLALFTGRTYSWHIMPLTSNKTLKRDLDRSLNQYPTQPVIADTGPGKPFFWKPETKDGFVRSHTYTITGYDKNGPDGGTVTVRNPWGGSKGTKYGEISITFDEFERNFFNLAHGNNEVRKPPQYRPGRP